MSSKAGDEVHQSRMIDDEFLNHSIEFDSIAGIQLILDGAFRILIASPAYYHTFRDSREETEGHVLFQVGGGRWNVPSLREKLECLLREEDCGSECRVVLTTPEGGARTFVVSARRMNRKSDDPALIHLAIKDPDRASAGAGPSRPVVLRGQPAGADVPPEPPARAASSPLRDLEAEESVPDTTELFKALKRRWALALSLGIVAAALAALIAWTVLPEPTFTASATIRVAANRPKILFTTAAHQGPDYRTFQQTQIALIRSRGLLKRVLERPDVADLTLIRNHEDPINWLERDLRAQFERGSEILRVSLSGEEPSELATLVNSLVAEYLRQVEHDARQEQSARLEALKEAYRRYQQELREKENTLKKMAESVGSGDQVVISHRQQLNLERLALAQRELVQLKSELTRARVELAAAERDDSPPDPIHPSVIEEELARDPMVVGHLDRIIELEGRLQSLRRVMRREGDPHLRQHLESLEAERRLLNERRERLSKVIANDHQRRELDETDDRVEVLRERTQLLSEYEEALRQEVFELAEQTRALGRESMEIAETQGDFEQLDSIAAQIRAESEAIGIEQHAPPRIRLLEPADIPASRDEKPRLKMTGMSAAGAFACVLMGVSYLEARVGRLDSQKTITRVLGIRVLGTLPKLPDQARRRLIGTGVVRGRRSSLYRESANATRAAIQHAMAAENASIVMITSALKGEGKTSLACQLAIGLARAGVETLLIDGDLRSPSADQLLGQPKTPGLSELLRGEIKIGEAIRATRVQRLSFLASGRADEESQLALVEGRCGPILKALRPSYRAIVIDTPPVVPVADPLMIGQHVDAVVLAARKDVSCLPSLRIAQERLEAVGLRTIGAVVAGESEARFYHTMI